MNFKTIMVIGTVAIGSALLMKKALDRGYPEIAKLPIKVNDELTQRFSNSEYEKKAVTVGSKVAEALIDERDNQNKRWSFPKYRWY